MTGILLALASALAYGSSDFIGGLVSRRTSAWSVAVTVQAASTVCALVAALLTDGSPGRADLLWSIGAGAGFGLGTAFLFRGLAVGRMSVVAPLSAVGSALLPVVVGLALGERPGLLVGVGLAVALPGIWLVAAAEDGVEGGGGLNRSGSAGSAIVSGVLAGLGFGAGFVALAQVPEAAGRWPLVLTQATSVVMAAGLAVALRADWLPTRQALRAAPAGLLGAIALITFQLAVREGLLSVASVLTALYPAGTILLAVLVLRERIAVQQGLGLALCGLTVALVAAG